MLSDSNRDEWGPLVLHGRSQLWVNSEGCVAAVSGDQECAEALYDANACLAGCVDAPDVDACRAFATRHLCASEIEHATRCIEELGVATKPEYEPCGHDPMGGSVDAHAVVRFFCGN